MVYNFCSSLDTDYRDDFKSFYEASPELRGDGGNGKNFYSYYSSRLALLKCLEEMGMPLPLTRLESSNHLHLDHYPHILTSISHTEYSQGQFLSAAVIGHKSQYRSLGIDIEDKNREVHARIISKFQNPKDKIENLEIIDYWTLKEAAFKALSPVSPSTEVLLKDIAITNSEFQFLPQQTEGTEETERMEGADGIQGKFRRFEIEHDSKVFTCAIAIILS